MSPSGPSLVSIALCTYNGEAFLPQQLDSLLAQDHPALELVAFDDASSDATWSVLQAYAPRFAHARLHRNPSNVGLSANFEQALRACRGEWIAPCDQDDVWQAHKLSRLLAATDEATTLVYADSMVVDEDGRPMDRSGRGARLSDRYRMVSGADPRMFALSNCVSGHAALVRRSVVERALPIPPGAYHDWWLAFVAANLGTLAYVPETLVAFRQHRRNASGFAGQLKQQAARSTRDKFDGECRNLASLASFPGPHQPFFQQLLALWRGRADRYWCPALVRLLYRHRDLVFAMKTSPRGSKGRHALKYLVGLRGRLST